jgi:hypothetical protein
VIAGASYFALLMWLGADRIPVSLNPFEMWRMNVYWFFSDALGVRLLADLFVVNYALLLFNLTMLFYPFDGGRIVQVILWVWMGYERSMRLATTLGMIGAVIAAGVGLWQGSVMLVVIAAFGFLACVQQRRYLKQAAAYEPDSDPRFAAAYETAGGERGAWFGADGNEDRGARHASRRPGMISRWRTARAEKRVDGERRRAVADDAEVNRILDKVREQGLASLSQREKDALQRATEKQRGR